MNGTGRPGTPRSTGPCVSVSGRPAAQRPTAAWPDTRVRNVQQATAWPDTRVHSGEQATAWPDTPVHNDQQPIAWPVPGYIASPIMETLTNFSSHSRQVNVATWFLVLPIDKENPYRLVRGWYIYTYIYRVLGITFYWSLPIYWVGDNRRNVNTSMTPHISDQLGTENSCKTLLCWIYRHDTSSGLH